MMRVRARVTAWMGGWATCCRMACTQTPDTPPARTFRLEAVNMGFMATSVMAFSALLRSLGFSLDTCTRCARGGGGEHTSIS
jgi:hypothetical protein